MATKKPAPKKAPASKPKQPAKKKSRSFGDKVKWFFIKLMLWFFGLSIGSVIFFKYIPVPFTPLMLIRAIENKMGGKEVYFDHDWEPIEKISMNLQKAVIASEDGTFLKHNGFDFKALQKAYKSNERGRRIRGGSTISQQTAKNVFLWHGRSFIRKGLEAYFTILIEIIWDKERILEVYLNVAEMGKMTFGVEAASLRYYKKSAKNLTRAEAARIAAVLPNPIRFSIKNPSAYVMKRSNQITRQMRALGGQKYIADL